MTAVEKLVKKSYHKQPQNDILNTLGRDSWKLVSSHGQTWLTIAVNQKEKQGIFIIRGSKNNTTDRVLDRAIMNGKEESSARFRKLLRIAKNVQKAYPSIKKWTASGHSSGGTMANLLTRYLGIKSHAFNPGITAKGLVKKNFRDKLNPKRLENAARHANVHVVPSDPLSNLSLWQTADRKQIVKPKLPKTTPSAKRRGIRKKPKHPHAMDHFV